MKILSSYQIAVVIELLDDLAVTGKASDYLKTEVREAVDMLRNAEETDIDTYLSYNANLLKEEIL